MQVLLCQVAFERGCLDIPRAHSRQSLRPPRQQTPHGSTGLLFTTQEHAWQSHIASSRVG